MKKILTLSIFVICFGASSQILTTKQDKVIRSVIASQFDSVADQTVLNLGKASFVDINKDTFFTPQGYNYVFKLTGDSAQRIDHCLFHGGNGRRFLFTWNNKIYALGGYGFFTTNNNLIAFSNKTREWSFEPTTGEVPANILGLTFKSGSKIYSFNNFKSGNNAGPDLIDPAAYILDLENSTWSRYQHPDTSALFIGEACYLASYCLFRGQSRSWLVKPGTMEYIILSNEELGFQPRSAATEVDRNTVSVRRYKNNGLDAYALWLNIDSVWKEKKNKAVPLVFADTNMQEASSIELIPVIALVLLAAGIGLYVKRQNKNRSPLKQKDNTPTIEEAVIEKSAGSPWLIKILNSEKHLLTTEELDELLNITFLEGDSRKLRRHRLLSELQKEHPGLITRIKDTGDKRRFVYRISPIRD